MREPARGKLVRAGGILHGGPTIYYAQIRRPSLCAILRRVGCEHTQPTTACKQQLAPRALYDLFFFPTHHSLYVVSSEAAAYYSFVYTAVYLLNKR